MKIKKFYQFFKDKHGKTAVVQWPNVWIILWAGLTLLSKAADQQASVGISLLAKIPLLIWAYLEITEGASTFRQVLGVVVMAFTLYSVVNI